MILAALSAMRVMHDDNPLVLYQSLAVIAKGDNALTSASLRSQQSSWLQSFFTKVDSGLRLALSRDSGADLRIDDFVGYCSLDIPINYDC